jgi:thiazole/oxazole-forming peptide maturase SagD family component
MQLDLPYVLMPGSLLHGDRLQCRLPTRTLSLDAPARVLRALHEFDGTLTPRDWLQRRQAEHWHADSVTGLLQALIDEGALVSLHDAPRHWWAYAENPRTLGALPDAQAQQALVLAAQQRLNAAPQRDAIAVDSRGPATALHALLATRQSRRSFGPDAIDAPTLTAMLWAAAGIVADADATRTTSPSAGALYPLQYFYVNLRDCGAADASCPAPLAAGVYRLTAAPAGRLHYGPIDADLSRSCAAFSSPQLLDHAQGVLVIAADFSVSAAKYGPRALSYVPLEAGHAAQNTLLAAAASGCHAVEIGGFIERELGRLLGLSAAVVPITTVFIGSACAEVDATTEGEFDWVDLHAAGDASFYLGRARCDPSHPWSWGRDAQPAQARLKAEMESRERAALLHPHGLVAARRRDLPGAVHPADVLRYRDAQYRRRSFPYQRFDDAATYWWKAAHDVFTDQPCFMLADLVYLEDALSDLHRPTAYTGGNTSGVASHASMQAALENAVLELIERDAFVRLWLGQAAHAVDETVLPALVQTRVQRLQAAGLRIELRHLPSPYCQVAFCFAQSTAHAFTRVASSAGYTLDAAMDHALMELEAQVYVTMHQPQPSPLRPAQVQEAACHAQLYRQKAYFRRADHLVSMPLPPIHRGDGARDGNDLLARLRRDGQRLIAVDLSEGAPLRTPTVRAFIPGLIPLKFGAGNAAEGHPAYQHTLQAAGRPRRQHAFPHPFN